MLPGVDHVLELVKTVRFFENIPKTVVVNSIRETLETLRNSILTAKRNIREESLSEDRVIELVKAVAKKAMTLKLKNLVNATGVVVHTNLGRSLLPGEVIKNIAVIAGGYSNLEYDLDAGKRGSRYSSIEDIV